MPFEFSIMLEYLTNKMTRDAIFKRIESKIRDKKVDCIDPAKDYLTLFKHSAQSQAGHLVGCESL
jgi:hypothetical protein